MKSRLLIVGLLLASCSQPPPPPKTPIEKAAAYLASKQSADGSWHGELEAVLRPGPAMTGLVLTAWNKLPAAVRAAFPDVDLRARKYLEAQVDRDGIVGLMNEIADYPNYATALAIPFLKDPKRSIDYLKRAQLDGDEGWKPEDVEYGGWAFGGKPRQKPDAFRLDVSTTRFVLQSLPKDDEVWRKARIFVERCQNFGRDKRDDGGFFFTPLKPFQNKAGMEEMTETTAYQYSYGSATSDGLACLRILNANAERIKAAEAWIEKRFTVKECPGFKPDQNPAWHRGLKGYWLASVAKRPGIADELYATQRADGSWINESVIMHENEPLLATALAVIALD